MKIEVVEVKTVRNKEANEKLTVKYPTTMFSKIIY